MNVHVVYLTICGEQRFALFGFKTIRGATKSTKKKTITQQQHLCSPLNAMATYMFWPYPGIFSSLAKSHSLLQSGQTLRVFNHRWMQSK